MNQKAQSFKVSDIHEFSFKFEAVFVGKAHLNGKIDKMIIDKTNKTITIVLIKVTLKVLFVSLCVFLYLNRHLIVKTLIFVVKSGCLNSFI